ncbi:MAG: hypothetical protein L6E13_05440 [Firmicutes bacterium]|nr:hypothetical protein [Bacillota bacterium]
MAREVEEMGAGLQEVRPGPIRGDRPPEPAEIVCVTVDKVYDFCFEEVTLTRNVPVREVPSGTQVQGSLHPERAQTRVVGEAVQGQDGLTTVTLAITLPATLRMGDQPPRTIHFVHLRTLQLHAPPGTQVGAEVHGTCFCHPVDLDGDGFAEEICCAASLCVVYEVTARVKLLLPSFGYCTPTPAREAPGPLLPEYPGSDG